MKTAHDTPDILIISLHHEQRTKWIFTTYMHTMYNYNVINYNYLSDCSLSAQFSCWCRSRKHFHDSTEVHTLSSLLHKFFVVGKFVGLVWTGRFLCIKVYFQCFKSLTTQKTSLT